jgi:hypothetical protein
MFSEYFIRRVASELVFQTRGGVTIASEQNQIHIPKFRRIRGWNQWAIPIRDSEGNWDILGPATTLFGGGLRFS